MAVPEAPSVLWYLLGVPGAAIFYGRFYVQWIVSEIKGKSVVPVAFWYMSAVGSLTLLAYGVIIQSPLGTLSHCFNIVVYARNLIHIWRGKGRLSKARNMGVHAAVVAVILVALGLTALTWLRELGRTTDSSTSEAARTWLWLAVGVAGQGLFALRFLIQWFATERKRESVVPPVFWWLSLAAALLMGASWLQRREWVYAIGIATTFFVYFRNLWLIYRPREANGVVSEEPGE
jgi:lipid-A-disaccharide synthase-like uncharacterized protein